jgi:E3 ubiquitin-protein ligase RFWD2
MKYCFNYSVSPICFDLIDVAHVTKCGHSFCQSCIQTALEHTHRCPQCNTPCSIQKDVFPNFTRKLLVVRCNRFLFLIHPFFRLLVNQIIERYKEETNNKKCKFSQSVSPNLVDAINTARDDLNIDDVNQLLLILSQRKEELRYQNKKVTELLLHDFLKHLQQVKSEELVKIQHELQMVNEDCKNVEEFLKVFTRFLKLGLRDLKLKFS